jgi:DNA-binding NtrC family response regulator
MSKKLNFSVVPLAEVSMNDTVVHMADRRPMVLVVDDEKVIADTLSIILSKSGFDTMTAYDATSALTLANATPPDLLISDVVMPGMTGVELAITMTHVVPACRVLLFSGQAATIDLLAKARESGHDFTTLTKPVHPTDMLRRVTQSLAIPKEITSKMVSEMTFSNPQFLSHLSN